MQVAAALAAGRPLNVAFVLRRFATDGGTEKYVADLARHLVGRGHEVHVYCAEVAAPADGVRFHPLRPAARRGLLGVVALARAAAAVPLDAHDVVQGFGRTLRHHVYRAGGGVHAAWLAARDHTLARRTLGALSPTDAVERWIDREAMRRARLVVFNSEMAARQAGALYGLPADRARVVRNGVDAERFRPDAERRAAARAGWGVPDDGRVALFLGHGFRRKGLAVAAAAFERAAGPRDRLVVVGRDAHAERWLRPLRERLADRLIVAGATTRPEDALPGADATLLPTLYDAAANTTLEAMACGVPAVTSARDGSAEIVGDRRLVVEDPADVDGFAAALATAWAERDRLGAEARKIATAWPVSRNADVMESIYRELADG